MGITINGPSGIDTASLIEQLVQLEYDTRVTPVEERKAAYELKISAYGKLMSYVNTIESKAKIFSDISSFNLFIENSTDSDIVTISGNSLTNEGSFSVSVYQLADNEKMASRNGLIKSQSESLSSFGISSGIISINGAEISVNDGDTIQDLREKINNASDSKGNSIGVTASVIRLADNNYRLILTTEETGNEGVEYRDVEGSVLQDLGIIVSADGDKGNTQQTLISSSNVESLLAGAVSDMTISISGIGPNNTTIKTDFVFNESDSPEDFLNIVEDAFHRMVTAEFEVDGTLKVTDKNFGNSSLSIDSFQVNGTDIEMNTTQIGQKGDGVLQTGRDAFFSIDGICLESISNEVSDVVPGLTIELHGLTEEGDSIELSLKRNYDGIIAGIRELVDSYNTLHQFVKESTQYGDTEDKDSERGDLAGDTTARSILNRIYRAFHDKFGTEDTKYRYLFEIGIETDANSGKLTIDEDTLEKALKSDFDTIRRMFIQDGYSDTSGISFGTCDDTTTAGTYEIENTIEGNIRIRLQWDDEWYTGEKNGEIVKFHDGPSNGLWLTIETGSLEPGETATFILSKGIGSELSVLCNDLTDTSRDGMIQSRINSFERSISSADDKIEWLEQSIQNYCDRLTREYAAMEQTLLTLQSQYDNMMSALDNL